MITKWKIQLHYNKEKDRYDLAVWNGREFEFVFDIPPCGNITRFFKELDDKDDYITWLINTGKEH